MKNYLYNNIISRINNQNVIDQLVPDENEVENIINAKFGDTSIGLVQELN
ncbi:hypothetical protein [Aureibacter tunicatorum]|uniref:Uncharacterized protein n=1 Tax=Aureibacter tunicatorum TaxID=866807 RepID=A0AAE4BRC6_9BACT|nr:hypothetical protein [Aureibacter tunicatorum]MDR6240069.1 hypothetical protein [Aureibacter tunicatorum]